MANQLNIWILDDDPGCHFVYQKILKNSFKLQSFETLKEFDSSLKKLKNDSGTLVIADLSLIDGNFLEYVQKNNIFKSKNIPFMVVSASDDVETLRKCFDCGAFDYLTKPFKKAEFFVKIENFLKGRVGFQPNPKEVLLDGIIVTNLTIKQVKLLKLFIESEDRAIDRNAILREVWGDTMVHPKTIDVHLYNLRRKLQGYGYMIKSEGGGKWTLLQHRINKG